MIFFLYIDFDEDTEKFETFIKDNSYTTNFINYEVGHYYIDVRTKICLSNGYLIKPITDKVYNIEELLKEIQKTIRNNKIERILR